MKKLKTVKICVKCHKRISESESARVNHCPNCGGSLIVKVIVKKEIHHRMPNGKEVYV